MNGSTPDGLTAPNRTSAKALPVSWPDWKTWTRALALALKSVRMGPVAMVRMMSGFVVLTVVISFGFGAAFAALDPVGMLDGNGLGEDNKRGRRVVDSFVSLSSPFWLSAWYKV